MRLDRIIQALLPHDEKFYTFFEELTQNIVQASVVLKKLGSPDEAERHNAIKQINDLEHQCDTVTHKIFAELNSTFVTPFDREDISLLAASLDDIIDFMDGATGRFASYKIKECPKDLIKLIEILNLSILEIQKGIHCLRTIEKADLLRQILYQINDYENLADTVFEHAIADLFDNEKDPIQVIKLKDIYFGLETATDKCEDAANVLETILIKHA
jgi:predicted phosphate transport protein (TIGR00153 family)